MSYVKLTSPMTCFTLTKHVIALANPALYGEALGGLQVPYDTELKHVTVLELWRVL